MARVAGKWTTGEIDSLDVTKDQLDCIKKANNLLFDKGGTGPSGITSTFGEKRKFF